ncbi:MAG TPA: hypothetical protein VMW53_10510, partial [archaeon]|nr:hypothetical protein [archaeon]
LLRTENAKTFKAANGKRVMRLHQTKQHYLDPEDGKYKEYDLSIKDVTPEAKADPKRKWDKYVDPGEDAPKTTWFDGKPYDYTFKDSNGDNYVSFEALYNTDLVTHELKYNKFGTDLFIIINDKADANDLNNELSWKLDSNADIVIEQDGSLVVVNSDIIIKSPWAKDADGQYIPVSVTLHGNTLTYTISILETTAFPITVDPSTTTEAVLDGFMQATSGTYLGARDTTSYNIGGNVGTYIRLGQFDTGGPGYGVNRGILSFPIAQSLNIVSISACSLYLNVEYKSDNDDFDISIVRGTQARPSVETDYTNFYGWQASGAYSVDSLFVFPYVSTTGMSVDSWYAFPFTSATGIPIINTVIGDTLHIVMLSYEDVIASAPTSAEFIDFHGSADSGKEPYLSIQYESVVPEDFTISQIAGESDSLLCEWTCSYVGEDGFRIMKSPYAVGDSIRSVMTADITAIRIGGLLPNIPYTLKVQIVDSESDSMSNADTEYTLAALPTIEAFAGYEKLEAVLDGYTNIFYGESVYLTARNKADADTSLSNELSIGQVYVGALYSVNRSHLSIPITSGKGIADITSCKLLLYFDYIRIYSDFSLVVTRSTKTGTLATTWHNDFNGWAASGVYTPINYIDPISVYGYTVGWHEFEFNSVGLDSIKACEGDTLHLALLSSKDVSATTPTLQEFFNTYSSAESGYEPYLLFETTQYSFADSTAKVLIDTTGTSNPSTTNYALKESNSGLFVCPVAGGLDTLSRTVSWNALSVWRAAGDTNEVYLRYIKQDGDPDSTIIGHTLNFQVNAKTDG